MLRNLLQPPHERVIDRLIPRRLEQGFYGRRQLAEQLLHLFDRPAFKNVICLGHILDVRGEKMAKSRGNVVNPFDLLQTYGADATRWYIYASAPPYNPRRFAPEHVGEMLRLFMLTLWNTYSFFVTKRTLIRGRPQINPWTHFSRSTGGH